LCTGIKTSEIVCAEVDTGFCDWLILTDEKGDGTLDSHPGTSDTTISLYNFEGLKDNHYEVIIFKGSVATLKIHQFQ